MARPPDDLDDPQIATGGLLAETYTGFFRRLESDLQAAGLSVQWFDVLMRLLRTPGHRLRMSDLAAQSTLTPSGLTRAVDRLEAAGLVRREACPSDRRGAFAVLTDAGEQRISAAVPVHVAGLHEVFSVLSREEVEQLTALLHRLRDSVNPDAARASEPRLHCEDGDGEIG